MKIKVLSDLHIEFAAFNPPPVECDVVVLAGDIHVGVKGLEWAAKTLRAPGAASPDLLYLTGNHEYYGGDLDRSHGRLRAKAKELGIHFLDPGQVVIDGVRFLGCNLWTDFCLFGEGREHEALAAAARYMTDYREIKRDGRALLPEETRHLHEVHRAWLERKLMEPSEGRWRKTVVCTHTLPTFLSVDTIYRDDICSAAFASNLDHLMRRADVWIHGHTHTSKDFVMPPDEGSDGGVECRVVCNPRGYLQAGGHFENPDFDALLVIEV